MGNRSLLFLFPVSSALLYSPQASKGAGCGIPSVPVPILVSLLAFFTTGASYVSDIPMASRTSFMVSAAAFRAAACLPPDIPSQPWILLEFLAPLLYRTQQLHQRIGHPTLALDAPMPADRQPTFTFSMVALSLKILCRSPTGQTSGFPGSERRTRAGFSHHRLQLLPHHWLGSVSMMVLPYDFDIFRPSVPGSLGAGVSNTFRLGKKHLCAFRRSC